MMTNNHLPTNRPGAVITGSSRGIGAAIARRLAAAGYGVSINYLEHADRADALVCEIERAGGRAVAVQADVSDYDQACALVEETAVHFGGIRIVVNNAGFSQHRTVDEMTIDDWNRAIAVNLSAALYTVKAALPYLKAEPWGRIINICSLRAMTGSNHGAHYAAAKAGLIGLTKSLALELAPTITANAVSPGYTNTEMNAAALAKNGDAIRAKIPAGRVAEPDEIAALVCFLASEEAGYITGETINSNGGIYMR
jgi:NAD(P)-dependent dehydrogenase (short-subunit alcohol dehydrogenase family)